MPGLLADFLCWCRVHDEWPAGILKNVCENMTAEELDERSLPFSFALLNHPTIEKDDPIPTPEGAQKRADYFSDVFDETMIVSDRHEEDPLETLIGEVLYSVGDAGEFWTAMQSAERRYMQHLGLGERGCIRPDEFYSRDDLMTVFEDEAAVARVFRELQLADDALVSGVQVIEWMRTLPRTTFGEEEE